MNSYIVGSKPLESFCSRCVIASILCFGHWPMKKLKEEEEKKKSALCAPPTN
jgi:hypothetical protein